MKGFCDAFAARSRYHLSMSDFIRWLQAPGNPDPALLGGKGANLSRLAAARLPVPAGFCLTTEAYRESVATNALDSAIADAFRELEDDGLAPAHAVAERLQALFAAAALPANVLEALRDAYATLIAQVGTIAVAVRSSATLEDLPDASFAGLYETLLNMEGEESVAEAVRRCYASLWSAQAIQYRRERGLTQTRSQMAVVVQRMAPAEASGVAFTADPLSGDRERIVINAAWGLGQGIVQGDVGGDTYVLEKSTYRVLDRATGDKPQQWLPVSGGGVEKRDVDPGRRSIPCLDDDMAAMVGRLAMAAERLLGDPQDVEWAAVSGLVHLLQSRPITALPQIEEFPVVWENEEDARLSWTHGNDSGLVSPLPDMRLQQSLGLRWWPAWNKGRAMAGARTATRVHYFNGYAYTAIVPIGPEAGRSAERLRAFNARNNVWLHRGTILWEAEVKPEIEANIARLERFPLRQAGDAELADHLADLLRVDERHWELHWQMGGHQATERFQQTVGEVAGQSGEAALRRLIAADGRIRGVPTKTRETVAGLRALASLALRYPAVARLLRERAAGEALASLPSARGGRTFLRRLRGFLGKYGHRTGDGFGSSSTIATPTWWEEPAIALEVIAKYVARDPEALEADEQALLTARQEALDKLLAGLDEPSRTRIWDALRLAEAESAIMEDHNFLIEQRTEALLRYGFMETARRWVEATALDARDDLYFLDADEIIEALRLRPTPALRPLVARRHAEWERWRRLTPPPYLGLPPTQRTEQAGQVEGTLIRGTPASTGRAVGRARVVDARALIPSVEPGEILVAVNAGPNWTPIFPVLGGLVLDAGEIFQHAALVAREYGIPAVIKTGVATQLIRDGQRIAVDGSAGTVDLAPEG